METRRSNVVTCACIACNGHVQFEAQHAGLRVNCPHCGTEITLYVPPELASAQPVPVSQPPPQPPPRP